MRIPLVGGDETRKEREDSGCLLLVTASVGGASGGTVAGVEGRRGKGVGC